MPQIVSSYDQYVWELWLGLWERQRRGGRTTTHKAVLLLSIKAGFNTLWPDIIIICIMDLSGYVLILKETEDNKAKLFGNHGNLAYFL